LGLCRIIARALRPLRRVSLNGFVLTLVSESIQEDCGESSWSVLEHKCSCTIRSYSSSKNCESQFAALRLRQVTSESVTLTVWR